MFTFCREYPIRIADDDQTSCHLLLLIAFWIISFVQWRTAIPLALLSIEHSIVGGKGLAAGSGERGAGSNIGFKFEIWQRFTVNCLQRRDLILTVTDIKMLLQLTPSLSFSTSRYLVQRSRL